jgi:hypothetical protein
VGAVVACVCFLHQPTNQEEEEEEGNDPTSDSTSLEESQQKKSYNYNRKPVWIKMKTQVVISELISVSIPGSENPIHTLVTLKSDAAHPCSRPCCGRRWWTSETNKKQNTFSVMFHSDVFNAEVVRG